MSLGESIRAALASFAADAPDNLFPRTLKTWPELVHIVNTNGGTLKQQAATMHIKNMLYTAAGDTYALLLDTDLTTDSTAAAMLLTPEGAMRLPVGLGANRQARDRTGRTALMHAAHLGDASAVEALLSLGADVWAQDRAGHTAHMYATPGTRVAEVLAAAATWQ